MSYSRIPRQSPDPICLHLGGRLDSAAPVHLALSDLTTHVFICGATGSGKTVLAKLILQEAAMVGVPAIAVDLKGDLSSMAIPLTHLQRQEIEPFMEDSSEASRVRQADRAIEDLRCRLQSDGLAEGDLEAFRARCAPVVFTPRSGKGVPLGSAAVTALPHEMENLSSQEPEVLAVLAASQASALVQRIYPGARSDRMQAEQVFLEEVIRHAWDKRLSLDGPDGLSHLVALVEKPPMKRIGAMSVDDFLPPKDRLGFARKMNTLLVGASRLWAAGQPISDIGGMLRYAGQGGKSPICVVNVSHLDSFADRAFVVSQLTCAVYLWMRRLGGTGQPRLLFFIDEIGGGGGRQAFFPSPPFDPPCKAGLNLLVRQGRAFGVGCIFATQNPGDVDYRGLTNCQTWFIGRLSTRRDRAKIVEGISSAEKGWDGLGEAVVSLGPAEFLVKPKQGLPVTMGLRCLLSYHEVVAPSLLSLLPRPVVDTPAGRKKRTSRSLKGRLQRVLPQARRLLVQGDSRAAEDLLVEVLREAPDNVQGLYLMGRILRSGKRLKEAARVLQHLLRVAPAHVYGRLQMALVQRDLGDTTAAVESLDAGLALNSDLIELHYTKAVLCERLGQPALACEHFRQARTLDPEHVASLQGEARMLQLLGRPDEAKETSRQANSLRGKAVGADAKQGGR